MDVAISMPSQERTARQTENTASSENGTDYFSEGWCGCEFRRSLVSMIGPWAPEDTPGPAGKVSSTEVYLCGHSLNSN